MDRDSPGFPEVGFIAHFAQRMEKSAAGTIDQDPDHTPIGQINVIHAVNSDTGRRTKSATTTATDRIFGSFKIKNMDDPCFRVGNE